MGTGIKKRKIGYSQAQRPPVGNERVNTFHHRSLKLLIYRKTAGFQVVYRKVT